MSISSIQKIVDAIIYQTRSYDKKILHNFKDKKNVIIAVISSHASLRKLSQALCQHV